MWSALPPSSQRRTAPRKRNGIPSIGRLRQSVQCIGNRVDCGRKKGFGGRERGRGMGKGKGKGKATRLTSKHNSVTTQYAFHAKLRSSVKPDVRWPPRRMPHRLYWPGGSRGERRERRTAPVSVSMVRSAVAGRLRTEKACASMRWQVELGPTMRPGSLGLEGRAAAVEMRVVMIRRRVVVGLGECMMYCTLLVDRGPE